MDCFNREVKKYTGRSVVIIVLVVLLHSRTCAVTFMYSPPYTSTLVPKKKFSSAQSMHLSSYIHLRSTTYVVLEPLEAPYVPSRMTISLNREWYAMVVWGDRQWS